MAPNADLAFALGLVKAIREVVPAAQMANPPARVGAPKKQAQHVSTAVPTDTERPPNVFVSWAHRHASWNTADERNWQASVASFAVALRGQGLDADVDLFHLSDADVDWTRYGPDCVARSDAVIIVMSTAWAERWRGDNSPYEGAGAVAEADVLLGMFQRDQAEFQRKCWIVLLPDVDKSVIPDGLRRVSYFEVDPENEDSYESLLRSLTNQPLYVKPPLGTVPSLPPAVLGRQEVDDGMAIDELRERLQKISTGTGAPDAEANAMFESSLRGLIEGLLRADD